MLDDSPFAALSYIAGPALMTNATSLLLLSTTNRYARALDRARLLAARIAGQDQGADPAEGAFLLRQLHIAERRVLIVARSLTLLYAAIGAFALGVLSFMFGGTLLRGLGAEGIASAIMIGSTTIGFVCVMVGSGQLVVESRLSFRILREEAEFTLSRAAGGGNRPG